MKKIFVTILMVIICAASAEAAETKTAKIKAKTKSKKPLEENVMLLHGMGAAALAREQYETAILYLKEVIRLEPKNAKAYSELGRAYCSTWNTTESLKVLKKAIALDPKLEAAYLNRAETYNRMRRSDEAIAECGKAIDINSSSLGAWGIMGIIQMSRGEDSRAIASFEKYAFFKELKDREMKEKYYMVMRSEQTEIAYDQNCYFLAQIYFKHNNFESAALNFERARPGYEADPFFYYFLATSYLKTGRYDNAIEEYLYGLDIAPEESGFMYNIACAYAKKADVKNSTEWLRKAIEKNPAFKKDAVQDEDFGLIREKPEFQELIR